MIVFFRIKVFRMHFENLKLSIKKLPTKNEKAIFTMSLFNVNPEFNLLNSSLD